MAFVSAPLTDARNFSTGGALRLCALRGVHVNATMPVSTVSTLSMKYGDYSYSTDKTKGHVQQYYVDKFRVAADFAKGPPRTEADAVLGRTAKGAVKVPIDGVPQIAEGPLARDPASAPDPRLAEAAGTVWPWDAGYERPELAKSTYADCDDSAVAEDAFIAFRDSCSAERGAMLTRMDFNATLANKVRNERGLSEKYMLTLEGQHDRLYIMAERRKTPTFLTPYGNPTTEIPGIPYCGSIGALDFIKKPETEVAFWKDDNAEALYKRPKGASMPDLPYNTSPSIESVKEAQRAAGIIGPA